MRKTTTLVLMGLALLLVGCKLQRPGEWEKGLSVAIEELGHRNWILIADAAYPAYSSRGVEIRLTGDDLLSVLKSTLKAMDKAGNVRPVIYLDKELDYVTDKLAPGISRFRKRLDTLLEKREIHSLPHEELLRRLDEASRIYRVLVLKTTLRLPYTSVFMELDCGYWEPEEEKLLRREMEKPAKKNR
jgi:L-fucose mutarotase/ribose pyranase (RbsD/FucU family)